jgi:hypothetical protein
MLILIIILVYSIIAAQKVIEIRKTMSNNITNLAAFLLDNANQAMHQRCDGICWYRREVIVI